LSSAADKTAQLLAALWVKNLPLVKERLATLDRAAEAASAGCLGEPLRSEAVGAAHKLAGSVGMYGYDEGTPIARELEVLLGAANPNAARAGALARELRRLLFPEG
jgi:HPt (histidine-containing phosphotransfer) domain-containing protein